MSPAPLPGRPVRGSTTGRPINAALDLLGRRWALRVLWELRAGEAVGFRELRARCDAMSTSVLRDRLVELVDAGILRQDDEGAYALTRLGLSLLDALTPLDAGARRWARSVSPTRSRRGLAGG